MARISPQLRSQDSTPVGAGREVPSYEAAFELSYRMTLASRAYLQPNLQWIIHPVGKVLGTSDTGGHQTDDAFVAGLRTSVAF